MINKENKIGFIGTTILKDLTESINKELANDEPSPIIEVCRDIHEEYDKFYCKEFRKTLALYEISDEEFNKMNSFLKDYFNKEIAIDSSCNKPEFIFNKENMTMQIDTYFNFNMLLIDYESDVE